MYRGEDIAGLASHLTFGRLDAVWGSRRLSVRDIQESYRLKLPPQGRARRDQLRRQPSPQPAVSGALRPLRLRHAVGRARHPARVPSPPHVEPGHKLANHHLLTALLRRRAEILEMPVRFFPIGPHQTRRTTILDGVRATAGDRRPAGAGAPERGGRLERPQPPDLHRPTRQLANKKTFWGVADHYWLLGQSRYTRDRRKLRGRPGLRRGRPRNISMRKTGYLLAAALVVTGTARRVHQEERKPPEPDRRRSHRRRVNHGPQAARAAAPADADGRHGGDAALRERDDDRRTADHPGTPGRARSGVHPARALRRQAAAGTGRPHRLHAAGPAGGQGLLLARPRRRRRQHRPVSRRRPFSRSPCRSASRRRFRCRRSGATSSPASGRRWWRRTPRSPARPT